jgi:hypothetical protein
VNYTQIPTCETTLKIGLADEVMKQGHWNRSLMAVAGALFDLERRV